MLAEKSITWLTPKLKGPIRSYFRAYEKIGTQLGNNEKWYLNCPESCFIKQPSHNYGLLSEEAICKLFKYKAEFASFDQYLSNLYDERIYLAVLREINGHTISQVSQAIKGVRQFDYRRCRRVLKKFSLDRVFAGVLGRDIRLEVEAFGYLVASSESAKNVSSVLENIFGISQLELNKVEGVRNRSLGAEGTAIRLGYNNVMLMILGEKELSQRRIEIRNSGRKLNLKIMDQFPKQRKFCPYTKEEQSRFHQRQIAKSQKFIRQFPGSWVDEVFTPVIREKSIAFVSEFEEPDRKVAVDILESHIQEFLATMPLMRKSIESSDVTDAITFFMQNEKRFVL